MITKRCLFCDKIVPVKEKGEYSWFVGCSCAPDSQYSLRTDSYDPFAALSYQVKHQTFPIVSGYIRDMSECGETVALAIDDLEPICESPRVPASIEEKADLLLTYFHRRCSGPNEAVVIRQLPEQYNLTYSPNLQEFVHIIEKLREDRLIERAGSTIRLTDKGWQEAAAKAGGKQLKPCFVILADHEEMRTEWAEKVFPKLEGCGYFPRLAGKPEAGKVGDDTIRLMSGSKLLIADLSVPSPEVYFAAGLALGLDVPVVWTVNRKEADRVPIQTDQVRPFVWDRAEELADLLQHRIRAL
ncbi:hypothetical protein PV433_21660 [Paenibacillus sp. GYB004]|uniref:hypothetical protein n=1 Tax=Paenibacillus sp. GYB004 TaxID=2994393 RepID=UPI002F96A9AF